jgi:aspartyl-tRNA(Asn)/glutamyl-tRNA(Gln) amidotransferase subunit A
MLGSYGVRGAHRWRIERRLGGGGCGRHGAMAIGSDGGGSVRIPASINGLFGLKGSMGRVPLYPGTKDETAPGVSGWESIEHIGPIIARSGDRCVLGLVAVGALCCALVIRSQVTSAPSLVFQ